MSAPCRSRSGFRSVTRTYNERSGSDVRLLLIIALVILVLALGLSSWDW
jgi:hypothetical protein